MQDFICFLIVVAVLSVGAAILRHFARGPPNERDYCRWRRLRSEVKTM